MGGAPRVWARPRMGSPPRPPPPRSPPTPPGARARGLATGDGLGMLRYQAVRGFQLWFGVRPEVTPQLRALVETDLTK